MNGLLDTIVEGEVTATGYLTNLGSVISAATGWVVDALDIFTDNPVLFVFVGAAVFGLVIGIVRSLVRGA